MRQVLLKSLIVVSIIITFTSYLFLVAERVERIDAKEKHFKEEIIPNK